MKFNILVLFVFGVMTFSTELYVIDFSCQDKSIFLLTSTLTQTLYSWVLSILNVFYSPLVFKSLTLDAISFTLKFVVTIALLVFIRGGVPRYRYDFLTKIGWIKFLSLVLLIFLSSLLLVYLF